MAMHVFDRVRVRAEAVTGSAIWPYLILTLSMAIFGSNHVTARSVEGLVPPVGLSFWRWVVATVILLPFTYARVFEYRGQIKAAWKAYALITFCLVIMGNTTIYIALNFTTAINGGIVTSAQPAATFVLSWLFFREPTSRGQFFGLLLAFMGVLAVITRGDLVILSTLRPNLGDLLMLVSVVGFAAYAVFLRLVPKEIPPLVTLNVVQLLGVLFLIPFYLWESIYIMPMRADLVTVAAVLWTGAMVAVVAMALWNAAIVQIGANRASGFVYVRLFFATLFSMLFLGERLQAYHLAAFAFIFSGIFLISRAKKTAP